jgi:exopolysaccharide biosynthesis polyprenyl glycosylphosphotransferase
VLTYSRQTRIRLLQFSDGALFALALACAYLLRATIPFFALPRLPHLEPFEEHLWLFPVIAVCGPTVLASQGFYQYARLSSRLSTFFTVFRGVAFVTMTMVVILFFVRAQFARSVIILACGFGGVLVYCRHELSERLASSRLAQSRWRQRVLWVGISEENSRLRASLSPAERSQIESISEFDPNTEPAESLVPILHEYSINAIVVNLVGLDTSKLMPVLSACEREGVTVLVRPGFFARTPFGMSIDWFAGEPVIYYRAQAAPPSHLVIKQMFDYVAAAVLLVLCSPLLFVLMLAIKFTSPGPIFFRQRRAGLNGRAFQLVKFRSMAVGAEKLQSELATRNEMTGPVFKVKNDPRVTPMGRFLRRHSLDELPQLWNVLRGEMSLVGPRPLPVSEVKNFSDDAHRRRLSVRPGLTCLWQIRGRSDISDFEEWVRLDLAYIDQWSLWLDAKILMATLPVVVFGKGAR